MRGLLLIMLLLAACSQAKPDNVDTESYRKAELAEFRYLVSTGVAPAVARARLLEVREFARNLEHDPEINYAVEQREKELVALHAVTCQAQPYLENCR